MGLMSDLSISNDWDRPLLYRDVYEQYAIDAAFLWLLRNIAIEQPHYKVQDVCELEQRIDAQLDGLMTSIDLGWSVCQEGLDLQQSGEVFTAMVVAMRSHDIHKIQQAVEVGLNSKNCFSGLVSAMGWLPPDIADRWTERFLKGKDMDHKYLGLAICSVRRRDPGDVLTQLFEREECLQHEKLYSRALRLVGELRRQDCMPAINIAMRSEQTTIHFWACWSAILLGHHNGVQQLKRYVFSDGPYQSKAIQQAFRILPIVQARQWISELSQDEDQIRAVIKASGVLGDPHAINWLIEKMREPSLAKLAGESFEYITGIDFSQHQWSIQEKDGYQHYLDDETDDKPVELDEDENLIYPNAEKVAAIWREHGQKFIAGRRYFLGQPITLALLKKTLVDGNQRQRHAAAMELALNENDIQLPNTRARILA